MVECERATWQVVLSLWVGGWWWVNGTAHLIYNATCELEVCCEALERLVNSMTALTRVWGLGCPPTLPSSTTPALSCVGSPLSPSNTLYLSLSASCTLGSAAILVNFSRSACFLTSVLDTCATYKHDISAERNCGGALQYGQLCLDGCDKSACFLTSVLDTCATDKQDTSAGRDCGGALQYVQFVVSLLVDQLAWKPVY